MANYRQTEPTRCWLIWEDGREIMAQAQQGVFDNPAAYVVRVDRGDMPEDLATRAEKTFGFREFRFFQICLPDSNHIDFHDPPYGPFRDQAIQSSEDYLRGN